MSRIRSTEAPGGPVFVEPAPDPNLVAPAIVEGARTIGIPTFENQNGRMMEGEGGAAIIDVRSRAGKRQSAFRSYAFPHMDRPNLTVLTRALVTRITIEGRRATGVEFLLDGNHRRAVARCEVLLSLGAIHTPKVLMQSGIGDEADLQRLGVPVVQHLPGVGQNLQDHPGFDCVWEYPQPLPPRNTMSEATFFWKSDSALDRPNVQMCLAELPKSSKENAARFGLPQTGWTMFGCVVQPKSRGRVRLTGPDPRDPVEIDTAFFSHPDDAKAARSCVELCREIGNSPALRPFVKREVMPGDLEGGELDAYLRDAVVSYWHESGTAKMGRDSMSVVDGSLKVYGIDGLRVADGSILPRVTTGNTMAPCMVVGERASDLIRREQRV